MARAVLLALLLGLMSPRVSAETARETVPAPQVSLNAGPVPAFTQLPLSAVPSQAPMTAAVPGIPIQTIGEATGRNPSGPTGPEVRDTGRLAPPDIFVPPKADRGFSHAPRRGEVSAPRHSTTNNPDTVASSDGSFLFRTPPLTRLPFLPTIPAHLAIHGPIV